MKYFGKYLLSILFVFTLVFGAQAQKFGYVNSQAILSEMPEVKSANAEIEALQKQLQKKGQTMLSDLQQGVATLQQKEQNGELSPKQLEDESKRLEAKQNEIMKFEQDMNNQVGRKQEALLQPILDKVNVAIKSVAQQDGYQFIFDSSLGFILYAEESSDVTSKVKAKLNM